jgi:sec-independent protein translocase protein TatB
LRTAGQWMGRARSVAREFQFQVDQMVRESELDDVRKAVIDVAGADANKIVGNWIDPSGEIANSVTAPELLGETAPPAAAPEIEPELPLLAPAIKSETPVEPAAPARDETPAPAEVKSGTHG